MTGKIRTTNAKVRSVAKPYEPTPGERLLMESYFARQAQTPAAPKLKVSDDRSGATEVSPDHPDPRMGLSLLAEALATTDVSFVVGLISQLADAGTRGRKVAERELNFMLAVVTGAKPKDQMEAMLAAQMAAVHMATVAFARRLANAENIAQQDTADRHARTVQSPCRSGLDGLPLPRSARRRIAAWSSPCGDTVRPA